MQASSVKTAFGERSLSKAPSSRQTIHALRKTFRETGSVYDAEESGRPVSVGRWQTPERHYKELIGVKLLMGT